MSPGRAWSALTIWRSFCFASALRTHVWTAAQPLPGILWPACWSEYVTKLAHHGLPGPTPAAARYLSTSAPVLTPDSWTPSWVWAKLRADAPSVLEPEPGAAAAAASTMPGTEAAEATALGGPAGGRAGGRGAGRNRARAALLRVHNPVGRSHELARVAGLGLRRERGSGCRRA